VSHSCVQGSVYDSQTTGRRGGDCDFCSQILTGKGGDPGKAQVRNVAGVVELLEKRRGIGGGQNGSPLSVSRRQGQGGEIEGGGEAKGSHLKLLMAKGLSLPCGHLGCGCQMGQLYVQNKVESVVERGGFF